MEKLSARIQILVGMKLQCKRISKEHQQTIRFTKCRFQEAKDEKREAREVEKERDE